MSQNYVGITLRISNKANERQKTTEQKAECVLEKRKKQENI